MYQNGKQCDLIFIIVFEISPKQIKSSDELMKRKILRISKN